MSTSRQVPVIRPLTAADQHDLASFACERYREPWSALVQEMISEHLAEHLGINGVAGVGLWADDELLGVAAWRLEGDLCRSLVLAVRIGYYRRGLGGLLKDTVIDEARVAGARAVVSHVHWDNDAMITLNVERGANLERIPGDPDHCMCVISLIG